MSAETGHQTAQLGQAAHTPNQRIARRAMPAKITEQLLAMIRSHWNLPIRTPIDTAACLLGHQGPHGTHHIRITLKMGCLKEIWPRRI